MNNLIQGLPQQTFDLGTSANSKKNSGGTQFMDTLRDALDQVGQLQNEADSKVSNMLNGDGQDVHSAMIAVEKASLSFELMVQVRNKIVSAYQEVSKMPF